MKKVAGFVFFLSLASVCSGQTILAVVNAASYTTSVAPGTYVAIFGTALAPGPMGAPSVPLPVQLNNVSVTIAGKAAPLNYVSPYQVNALVPFDAASLTGTQKATVPVVVTTPSGTSPAFNVTLTRNAPAIFTKNAAGTGDALVFDAYFQPVTAVGTGAIVIYATGLGPTNPPASTGNPGASAEPLNRVVDPLSVVLGQNTATILFAGLAPGMQGVYQLNLAPNPALGNTLSLSQGSYASNLVTVPVAGGTNVANATASIDGLYPASGPIAAQYGGKATSGAIGLSALLLAGTFTSSFDILPTAKPFQVFATVTAPNSTGNVFAVIAIDAGNNTWQATYTVPATPSRFWDFSSASGWGIVMDFLSGYPFPGNVIPMSRVDPIAATAISILPQANSPVTTGANSAFFSSGTLPPDRHFMIGAGFLPQLSNFGGFTNLTHVSGDNSATFQLFVDNLLVASKSVPFTVY
jgi:uncharacterized protein (TIGR03437 family)